MKNQEAPLAAKESLGTALYRNTWPMLFGVLALMTNNLVDAAWIALLGVEPLAALGFSLPVHQVLMGLQIGLGIATTAIISRTLGAGKQILAQQQGGLILLLGASLLAVVVLVLWFTRQLIFNLLGASAELIPVLEGFWPPWLFSIWLGAVVYLVYSQHRANNDTRFTGWMMLLVSLLNLILDPVFIFVLGWGLPGAAWATSAAFAIGGAIALPRLWRKKRISLNFAELNFKRQLHSLLAITGPASLSQLMPAVAALIATGLVAGFGTNSVAAWGLGARLESFSLVVVLALTMSLPPMLGRFAGAQDWAAVEKLLRLAIRFVLLWQLGVALIWLALSQSLVALLTSDISVATLVHNYLLKLPFSYTGLGVCILLVSASNALGMPLRALLISLLRLFACYLPLLWLGAYLGEMNGLFTGALLGNLLTGIMAWHLYRQGAVRIRLEAKQAH